MGDQPATIGDDVGTETGTDSRQRFAADLRRLRLDAGNPTLTRLQDETGISRTVLSDAFAGRQLPSARTIDGIVRACDADAGVWLDRRDALAELLRSREHGDADAPVTDAETDAPSTASTGAPRLRRRTAVWLAVGAFVVGSLLSGSAAALVTSNVYAGQLAATGEAAGPQIAVETGEDPGMTACVDDAQVATGDTRADNSLLEIVWSDKCQAGWGRITRYDGLGAGNTVTIAIYPQTSPEGPDRQEATEHDVQGAYTTLVVRPSPDTLLCAEGSFTVDGTRIDLGDPLCI